MKLFDIELQATVKKAHVTAIILMKNLKMSYVL